MADSKNLVDNVYIEHALTPKPYAWLPRLTRLQ